MQARPSLDETLALMRDLRQRCEWDAAQTHESLRPYLVEEASELDDALRSGDDARIREELGDVLLQVLFHSVMGEERGAFDFHDVAHALIAKMRARHPHLYDGGTREPWERMKASKRTAIAEGMSATLPALHRAHRLQDRAGGAGFDWPDVDGPANKVSEELEEVKEHLAKAPPRFGASGAPVLDERHAAVEAELGDLLFAVVNLCRKSGVHASLALDKANDKFLLRFESIQRLARERGIAMGAGAGLEALDELWDEVKRGEGEAGGVGS